MLNSGSGPSTTGPGTSFMRTSVVPTCDVAGHNGSGSAPCGFASSATVHRSVMIGLAMKPAGRSMSTSFVGSTGQSGPNGGFGFVTVLRSIAIEAANGGLAAWVKGFPAASAVT